MCLMVLDSSTLSYGTHDDRVAVASAVAGHFCLRCYFARETPSHVSVPAGADERVDAGGDDIASGFGYECSERSFREVVDVLVHQVESRRSKKWARLLGPEEKRERRLHNPTGNAVGSERFLARCFEKHPPALRRSFEYGGGELSRKSDML
jgi:hypothetical protein